MTVTYGQKFSRPFLLKQKRVQEHRMNYLLHLWELKNNAMPLGPKLASPYPLPSEV